MNAAEAPLVSPQSSLPHHSLLAPCSGWQVCHGDVSTTSAHRGAVSRWMGGRGASTVKSGSSVGQMPRRCSVGGLQLWLSEKSWKFALSFASTGLKSSQKWIGGGGGKLALLLWPSLRCSPGGGGSAHRRQVVVSRDVAVHREVVVALGVLVGSVTEGTLTLCGQKDEQQTEINTKNKRCFFFILLNYNPIIYF